MRQSRSKLLQNEDEEDGLCEEAPVVVQIQDVSGKMLYTEAEAKQRYTTMMQASVSHELRNPLSSMIYQFRQLRDEIMQLLKICLLIQQLMLQPAENLKQAMIKIFEMLMNSVGNVRDTSRKLVGLAQYIDFFIHDMLDFGILSEKSENFTKTLEVFDIRAAFDEVVEIFHEKISSKQL